MEPDSIVQTADTEQKGPKRENNDMQIDVSEIFGSCITNTAGNSVS